MIKPSKWVFGINQDHQIDFDRADKSCAKRVKEGEPTFNLCISCGTCTATCPITGLSDYNPRRMQVLLRRGMLGKVQEMVIKCQLCGKCEEVCPRGVRTRNVYLLIREEVTVQATKTPRH